MFFIRIAKALPDILTIASGCTRSRERLGLLEAEGVNAFTDMQSALSVEHDAVIVASGREGFFPLMRKLKERGEFVISETTFLSLEEDELKELEDMEGATAEQYMFTPLYSSLLAALPLIGDVDQLYLSGLHNHHSASIARKVLGFGYGAPESVAGETFRSRMLRTGSREGMVRDGSSEEYERKIRMLRFGEKLFIHDFSSNQYHSYLYGKRFEARGSRGVMTESEVRIVDSDGYPLTLPFVFHRDTYTGNGSMTLSHATLGERTVFTNPFYPLNLNDDEIGIALLLKSIEEGGCYPSIREGIEDARLGRLL